MVRRLLAFLALFLVGALDAQAAPRSFPSLAKRPAEAQDRFAEPAPAPVAPPAASDPQLVETVDALKAKALQGDAVFQEKLAGSRETVTAAASAEPVSEAWVAAEMAISVLDAARYDSVAALASLDTLHVDHRNNADSARVAADMATIDPARAQVLALVDSQNDALDGLKSSLRQP